MSSSKLPVLVPALLFLCVLSLYIHNLSRSVYGGDVGDLVSAAYVFGVPHAPGYPLFTLLGYILSHMPLGQTPAFNVGLISAFSGSLLVLIYYFITLKLTKHVIISLLSSLVVAFSYYVWFYSEIAEVFMLNAFFAIALFFVSLHLRERWSKKLFWLFCFLLGLASTHHQTIVLVIPSFFLLWWPQRKKLQFRHFQYKSFLAGAFFFLLGFSVYVYVPIASSYNPPINWDQVHDIPSFIHLLLRKDYGTFTAGVFESPVLLQRVVLLKMYASQFIIQLTLPVLALCMLGSIYLFRRDKNYLAAVLLGVFISGPVFVAYAGFPPHSAFFIGIFERFFLLSFIFFLLLLPFGFLGILEMLGKTFLHKYQLLFLAVFFLIPFLLFTYNYPKTNLSSVYIGDYLGMDSLSVLPKNAILLSSGDTLLFNTWYAHYVLGIRPDVTILNANALGQHELFKKKQKEYAKLHPGGINPSDELARIIEYMGKDRSVFSYLQIQPKNGEKFHWVPYGIIYKLVSPSDLPSQEEYEKTLTSIWDSLHTSEQNALAYKNLTISEIPVIYSDGLLITGNYLLSEYQATSTAQVYYNKARMMAPENPKVYLIQGVHQLSAKNCENAEQEFKKTIEKDPLSITAYVFLYTTYSECYHDSESAKRVAGKFKEVFTEDILTIIQNSFKK